MNRLEILDYGRFFAAIIVIFFHYTYNGIANGKITSIIHIEPLINVTKYGYLGVELFFIISGYVIFLSAKNKTASDFAVSRATRLYPAYWFAVLFTSFFALKWGGSLMSVSPSRIIANLSMLQSFVGVGHVDGVYWTLTYEITFYFAVFLLLFIGMKKYINIIFIFWPLVFCIAYALNKQSLPYMGGYYYYFSAGTLFAILRERFDWKAFLSLIISYVFCINFSTSHVTKGIETSPVVIVSIITLFFFLFVFQNIKRIQSIKLPMSKICGSLTYPVYLIHAHFGYMFISHYATEENKLFVYILTILIVLSVSLFVHVVIEKRFSYIWRKLFNETLGRLVACAQTIMGIFKFIYKNKQTNTSN